MIQKKNDKILQIFYNIEDFGMMSIQKEHLLYS